MNANESLFAATMPTQDVSADVSVSYELLP